MPLVFFTLSSRFRGSRGSRGSPHLTDTSPVARPLVPAPWSRGHRGRAGTLLRIRSAVLRYQLPRASILSRARVPKLQAATCPLISDPRAAFSGAAGAGQAQRAVQPKGVFDPGGGGGGRAPLAAAGPRRHAGARAARGGGEAPRGPRGAAPPAGPGGGGGAGGDGGCGGGAVHAGRPRQAAQGAASLEGFRPRNPRSKRRVEATWVATANWVARRRRRAHRGGDARHSSVVTAAALCRRSVSAAPTKRVRNESLRTFATARLT
eukprot:1183265-Prorocentrum_minimum.AAC.4